MKTIVVAALGGHKKVTMTVRRVHDDGPDYGHMAGRSNPPRSAVERLAMLAGLAIVGPATERIIGYHRTEDDWPAKEVGHGTLSDAERAALWGDGLTVYWTGDAPTKISGGPA